jgi:DNA modification methylase
METGTTAKVSSLFNRKWVGSEINDEYCEVINQRVEITRNLFSFTDK